MNAVILAAGKGSRLEHLGSDRPKCLLSINGKTALTRLIETINHSDAVDKIFVVGGHCIDQIRDSVPPFVTVLENENFETTNSIISLDVALPSLPPGDLVFFNSDIVYEQNLLIRYLGHPEKTACLIDETIAYVPGEFHVHMHDARVAEISSTMPPARVHGRDAQVYRVEDKLVPELRGIIRDIVRERGPGEYAGQVMLPLLQTTRVHPVFTNGDYWGEFDTPEDYAEVNQQVSATEKAGRSVASYGLSASKKSGDREPVSDKPNQTRVNAFRGALSRIGECVRERRLPSKLDKPRHIMRCLFVRPIATFTWAWPLLTRRLSWNGFLLQLHGAGLLRVLVEESENLGITPFLVWGTLLGCTRENAFIFNDGDVDVGLSNNDFELVHELRQRMADRGFGVRRQDKDKISFLHPSGLHIDVDRFYKDESCYWIQTEHYDDSYIYSNFFPLNTFNYLERVEINGVETYAPSKPELFLRTVYGAWQIPEDKRDIRRGPLNLYLRPKEPSI